jgi:hypothetical protein
MVSILFKKNKLFAFGDLSLRRNVNSSSSNYCKKPPTKKYQDSGLPTTSVSDGALIGGIASAVIGAVLMAAGVGFYIRTMNFKIRSAKSKAARRADLESELDMDLDMKGQPLPILEVRRSSRFILFVFFFFFGILRGKMVPC